MTDDPSRDKWGQTKLIARVWQCGDTCHCCQAKVEEVSPNRKLGRPFIHRKILCQGTFFSDPSPEEWKVIGSELASMAEDFDVPRNEIESLPWILGFGDES